MKNPCIFTHNTCSGINKYAHRVPRPLVMINRYRAKNKIDMFSGRRLRRKEQANIDAATMQVLKAKCPRPGRIANDNTKKAPAITQAEKISRASAPPERKIR